MNFNLNPKNWASLSPLGLGHRKPHHLWEFVKAVWNNKHNLSYAYRILKHGSCDACCLGSEGMKDPSLGGTHSCRNRINQLKLNTQKELDPRKLTDAYNLSFLDPVELQNLGRLTDPMVREKGQPGFQKITWEEALQRISNRIKGSTPERVAFYLNSRGQSNEDYYVTQKVIRSFGTNNIDTSSRVDHFPSLEALGKTLHIHANDSSLGDWLGTELIVLFGSNLTKNQPALAKQLYRAKQQGAKIAIVNPYREPGLMRTWIPSVTESALFGTKLADYYFQVPMGGDVGFLNGVLKILIANDWIDHEYIQTQTEGWDELVKFLNEIPFSRLEAQSGVSQKEMMKFAVLLADTQNAVFAWSKGLTQNSNQSDAVTVAIQVAMASGFVGREKNGLMSLPGQTGAQGAYDMGASPTTLPGGIPIDGESAQDIFREWEIPLASKPGLNAFEMIEAALQKELDFLFLSGGSFSEILPQKRLVDQALANLPLRVHHGFSMEPSMLVEPQEEVILLPAMTRYEHPGGTTETTLERRIIYSPEIHGSQAGESKCGWQIFTELSKIHHAELNPCEQLVDAHSIREEISAIVPRYQTVGVLKEKGDSIQWGGSRISSEKKSTFQIVKSRRVIPTQGKLLLGIRTTNSNALSQPKEKDAFSGIENRAVLMSFEDARQFKIQSGDVVRLHNEMGEEKFKVALGPIARGSIQLSSPIKSNLLPNLKSSKAASLNARILVNVDKVK